MGAKHNSKRLLVAAITIAGLAGGAMAAQADTLAQRVTALAPQDLSVTSPPVWPAIGMTPCPASPSPCPIALAAGTSTVPVSDVPNGSFNVPILGFGVNGGALALAGAPTSTIKVPVGTTLTITLTQPTIADTIDLSFPSLGAGKVTHVGNVYTVIADRVGTSVFQPGANKQAPVQVAMGLVGVLIVTPKDGGGVNCAACAYDAASSYADEALVATTDLDFEFATTYPNDFDMSYFGQPKHADDTPRRVYHVINGKSFPNTDVIDARAGDKVLLRYVNAGVSDKTMGLLGLRQTLLARNASAYQEKQTLIAPLIGPGETADAEVVIPGPGSVIAGQKYSLMDQGRQMNHGTDSGYGGALTFLNVWTGTAPTISAAAYDASTQTVTAIGTPSSTTNTLTGFQTLVTDTAATPLEADWPAVEVFSSTTQGALAPVIKILSPAPAIGKFVWVRVQQGGAYSAPTSVQVGAIAPTVSAVAYGLGTVTGTGVSDPALTITGFQTAVNVGGNPLPTDWSATVVVGSPASSVAISGSVAAILGDTVWVRVQDSNGTFSAAGSVVVAALPPLPPPVIADPAVSAVGFDGANITATGDSDPSLTITGYQTAVTNLDTDAPSWSGTVLVASPASTVSISEPASPSTGQWVWVQVQDSNGTWSAAVNAVV